MANQGRLLHSMFAIQSRGVLDFELLQRARSRNKVEVEMNRLAVYRLSDSEFS